MGVEIGGNTILKIVLIIVFAILSIGVVLISTGKLTDFGCGFTDYAVRSVYALVSKNPPASTC